MLKKMKNKKLTMVCTAIFMVSSILSTIHAAAIDAGLLRSESAFSGAGNYMSFGRAILFDIPLGISEGLLAVIIILSVAVIYWIIQEIKEDIQQNA